MKILNFFKNKTSQIEKDPTFGLLPSQLIARELILSLETPLDQTEIDEKDGEIIGIDYNSDMAVHAIIVSDFSDIYPDNTYLSLSIARQIALVCHFPNFNENNGNKRTKITIINSGTNDNMPKIVSALRYETGNLLDHCHWTIDSIAQNSDAKTWIDIEFNLINLDGRNPHAVINNIINKNELISIFYNKYSINASMLSYTVNNCLDYAPYLSKDSVGVSLTSIRRAKRLNMVYQEGTNLVQVQGINEINEYKYPIKIFCNFSWERTNAEWEKMEDIKLKLSSIFCGDCFEFRLRCAGNDFFAIKNNEQDKTTIRKLAYTEHSRWNVEKLILGYKPYTKELDYEYFSSYGEGKKRLRKRNRANNYHVDLRSCNELIRVNKEDIKYDYFLTLCIPHILKREKENK